MGDPFRVDILVLSDYPRVLRTPRLPRGDAFSVFPYKAFSKIRRRFQRLSVQSVFKDSEYSDCSKYSESSCCANCWRQTA